MEMFSVSGIKVFYFVMPEWVTILTTELLHFKTGVLRII
jgi:hypothetical protein